MFCGKGSVSVTYSAVLAAACRMLRQTVQSTFQTYTNTFSLTTLQRTQPTPRLRNTRLLHLMSCCCRAPALLFTRARRPLECGEGQGTVCTQLPGTSAKAGFEFFLNPFTGLLTACTHSAGGSRISYHLGLKTESSLTMQVLRQTWN